MRTGLVLQLGLLCLGSVVLAQDDALARALAVYPECAQECIVTAFGGEFCAPTDQTCICTNTGYQTNVSTCVALTCSVTDGLSTRNSSLTACHAPVRDHAPELKVISNVMLALCLVAVVARFAYKIFFSSVELGVDDWTVLAASVTAVGSIIMANYGTIPNGLGKDIWTVEPQKITLLLKYFYMMAWLYFLQTALVKLSLISFFIRIFPSKGVQQLLWGTFIFVCIWGLAFIFLAVFQCRPISYFWTKWDGLHEGTCLDANSISWANAGIGIAIDIWILSIPLWQLRSLQLHWKKKIGVAMMFCVGTFVTIVSILRLRSLVDFAKDSNVTWSFYDVSVWSTVEISIGIVCACLPAIRLLFVHFFPALSGSSLRSTNKGYQQYNDGGPWSNSKYGQSTEPRFTATATATATASRVRDEQSDQTSINSTIFHDGNKSNIDIDEVHLVDIPQKGIHKSVTVQVRSGKD